MSVQIPGDRAKIKRRVNLLPPASSLETKLSLMVSTYKNNITWMYVRTNRIQIGSQLKKSRITFMRRDLPQNYALMPVLFLDQKRLLSVTCY